MSANHSSHLDALNRDVAACDQHHHLYHYKSSHMHLCYGLHLRASGDEAAARKEFEAAVFQDHLNSQAKEALSSLQGNAAAIQSGSPRSTRHDGGAYDTHIQTHAIERLATFEASLGWEPDTSMVRLAVGEYLEALRICNDRHQRYHRHASNAHLSRGRWHEAQGNLDLAIADYSKALDLNSKNQDALHARATLYRLKENPRLAEADEARLKAI